MTAVEQYRQNAEKLVTQNSEFSGVLQPLFDVLQFVNDEDFRGACSACSAILYILLALKDDDANNYTFRKQR